MTKPACGQSARRDDGFEEARQRVLDAALSLAPFSGWTRALLEEAASEAGVDPATLAAALPDGALDLLRLWSERLDDAMAERMRAPDFGDLKIREKVRAAVVARLGAMRADKEAAQRAAGALALPMNAGLGARLAWRTADRIWREMGDASTDFNFYSKRTILSGVWTTTFARWLADDDPDERATREFLDARIDNVMGFEKIKAKARDIGLDPGAIVERLARLRYADR